MNENQKKKLLSICENLIEEATIVMDSTFSSDAVLSPNYVDKYLLDKWWGKIKSFIHILGPLAKPWKEDFNSNPTRNLLVFVKGIKGTLEAIHHEISNDHLVSMYTLLRAETLSDLFDQAFLLLENGYYLAAGVIGRAVLEEHLRTLCTTMECMPSKKNPTINDYNLALYKDEYYSKIKMKQVDALTAIGNDAAHNNPSLTIDDVKKLVRDLPEFIDSTS